MRRLGVLVALGILLVTGVWWMLLISPKNSQIADLEDELTIAIDTEQRLRVQIKELEAIRQAEVEYLAALGQIDALIPERPMLDEFIEQIFALTGATGVELQRLTPSLPTALDESDLREVSVSAQIQGEFFEVLGFLFGLNDMERLVRVDAIAVSSSLDESGETVLSASIEMRLFTLADVLPLSEEDAVTPGEDTSGGDTGANPDGANASGASA